MKSLRYCIFTAACILFFTPSHAQGSLFTHQRGRAYNKPSNTKVKRVSEKKKPLKVSTYTAFANEVFREKVKKDEALTDKRVKQQMYYNTVVTKPGQKRNRNFITNN